MTENSQTSFLQQFAKTLNLGKLIYRGYYAPKGFLEKCQQRGYVNTAVDYWFRVQMEADARQLPPVAGSSSQPFDIYFLSGKKFWYQTCFCAYSMAQHADVSLRPVVFDDGTLTDKYAGGIRRIFPDARVIPIEEITERLETELPAKKFPYLRERHINYPNIRKLIDIHLGSEGWKLVLDSDMLFFNQPEVLVNWLKSPQQLCCMVDTETSYGYSDELMRSLAGAEIPERINVGICGLNSSHIDWEKLEFWCKTLIEKEGSHYYQEQALIAMLFAGQPHLKVPEGEYVVMPDQREVMEPRGTLHHYVADSKPWYFRYGWQQVRKNSLGNDSK